MASSGPRQSRSPYRGRICYYLETSQSIRRNVKAADGEDNKGEAVGEDVSHQPGVGSSSQFPPELKGLFSQGAQTIRSERGESFQRMGRRLDSFKAHLTSHANEIRDLGNDMHSFYERVSRLEDQGFDGSTPCQG
ncbi:hypothetical protein PIB30_053706 [Stylosanthes scabra]|uniref:Uncharacterized protein n=1 Tax=Stylosanthes scabra TaxID=79078 RepID=A0ABU6ZHE7_9FABA|nr:hypothetical protein [Stylosanthes scabra]